MLDTVVISSDDVCCSVVFCTLVGVFVFSVMWSELLMISAIILLLSVRNERGILVMYCMQCCVRVSFSVVCGCAVSRMYINVCNCYMFSVVNMYIDHLKFYVVCINGRRYVCCSQCNDVSNECNEPTPCLVQPIGTHGGKVMYIGCVCNRGELGSLNCDDICVCVVNKQFELLEFVLIPFMLTCNMIYLALTLGLCPYVVFVAVLGLSVTLSRYLMWMR